MNLLKIGAILIAVLFLIVILIRSTIAGAAKSRIHSVYLKILMNHLQLLVITATIKMDWPDIVGTFFSSTEPVGQPSVSIFSLECIYQDQN